MRGTALQTSLFAPDPQVLLEDAEGGVCYRPGVIDPGVADRWFAALREGVDWKSVRRPMYDRVVDVPRLVAAYRLESPIIPDPLPEIASRVRAELGQPFNTVGLNLYRDGRDSVAPHSDKLHMLRPGHPIALLSLGSTRRMTIRAKAAPRAAIRIDLEPGSLLVMSYDSQLHYDHGIPKIPGSRTRAVPPRMSLAFRVRPGGTEPMPARSAAR